MSLDLAFDDGQQAIADALDQFCRDRCDDDVVRASADAFPRALWREVAGLGVFAAATEGEAGGALEIGAAMEALGRAVFPGPLYETIVAVRALPSAEAASVADGEVIVACGCPPLLAFAPVAGLFLEIEGDRVYRATPRAEVEVVHVLGGGPFGRVALDRGEALANGPAALVLGEIALAAYLAGGTARLIEDVAEHVRTRQQFGKPIGDFQAVAHPLADCTMRVSAARALARAAAFSFDHPGADGAAQVAQAAASARLSCGAAAIEAVHVAHQLYGAVGITLEGPAFHITRRLRQLVVQSPGPDRAREHVLARIGLAAA